MARQRKPSGRLSRGPFTAAEFHAALKLGGWSRRAGGHHTMYVHTERPGKVQVDEKWTGVKTSHDPFKGVLAQSGYTKTELLRLLNGLPLN
jgi:hypothetical protein